MENQITYKNFDDKAEIYARTRASYSNNYLNLVCEQLSLLPDTYVADIAAGTGINTKLIAKYCKEIIAVEPNESMLTECRNFCSDCHNVKFVKGISENVPLADHSVNLITIAQAFQLLDLQQTRSECKRLLRENGKVILVWNSKETKNEFFYATEKILLQYCPVYSRNIHVVNFEQNTFSDFFVDTTQFFKFLDDGCHFITKSEFVGRALCASYSLCPHDEKYKDFIYDLENIFEKYSKNGLVYAPLSTVVYIGDV